MADKNDKNSVLIITFIFSLIPDSFVNSQEWTLARSVPDLKLVSCTPLRQNKAVVLSRNLYTVCGKSDRHVMLATRGQQVSHSKS